MNEEEKNYEVGFLARSEQDRDEVAKILESYQLPIIYEGQISKIKLAYPIKKENFACFGFLYFSGDPAIIEKLSSELRTNPKILRFLIILRPILRKDESREIKIPSMSKMSLAGQPERSQKVFSEQPSQLVRKAPIKTEALSNEDLEKKLEEILK